MAVMATHIHLSGINWMSWIKTNNKSPSFFLLHLFTFLVDMHFVGSPSLDITLYQSFQMSLLFTICVSVATSAFMLCSISVLSCAVQNSLQLRVRQCRCLIFCHLLFLMQTSYTSILYLQMYSLPQSQSALSSLKEINMFFTTQTYNVSVANMVSQQSVV